ncbi:MAG: hypothetical protein ACLP3K_03255 [Candidatus Acidiferrales bacterium]
MLNAYLGIDNRLFVDPNLLKATEVPELKDSRAELENYFVPIIKLLKASKAEGDVAWEAAVKRLIFKEEHGAALGYASAGGSGRGVGPDLARMLVRRGKEIVDLDISAPEMFELIGLFQEKFGPDLLSDMAVGILLERFLAYTERVTAQLKLQPNARFRIRLKDLILPLHPDHTKALIFVPSDVLTPLPAALDMSEISEVAQFNDDVRRRWNEIIAAASKQRRKPTKSEIREMLFARSQNVADLIEVYRKAAGNGYDFSADPSGLFSWDYIGRTAAANSPLKIDTKQPKTTEELREIVNLILQQFKKNIEQNKLYEMLYDDAGNARHERFAQRLFFAIADSYCKANDVDISREPNAGNGPVDFKLSAGYQGRLLVEIKKSNNPDLLHGFDTQLEAYQNSEATQESVYLILRVSERQSGVDDVLALCERKKAEGLKVPEVIVIDARKTPSASKR